MILVLIEFSSVSPKRPNICPRSPIGLFSVIILIDGFRLDNFTVGLVSLAGSLRSNCLVTMMGLKLSCGFGEGPGGVGCH